MTRPRRWMVLVVWCVFSTALQAAAPGPRERFLRAVQNLEQRRYAPALRTLRTLYREEPGDARVVYYLGRAYYETGDLESAARYFQYAVHLNPGLSGAHLYLGKIALELDRPDAARMEIGLALRLDDRMAMGHYWMGKCQEALRHPLSAAKEYRRALKLDPSLGQARRALRRLGRVREKSGLYKNPAAWVFASGLIPENTCNHPDTMPAGMASKLLNVQWAFHSPERRES